MDPYNRCLLCNRGCGVDRKKGGRGFCGEGASLRIAWAGIHRGEEPVLCGSGGSGTIFFTGCTLKCFFCQNCQLSRGGMGAEITVETFAALCLKLQDAGVENINLVTGTHWIPSIVEGIRRAKEYGLQIPVLWNSSGFENDLALSLLEPWIDVYLPDLKTLDPSFSKELFGTPRYPETATKAIQRMVEIRAPQFDEDRMVQGVIVRHLVLPGFLENTREVLQWFSQNLRYRAILSLMFQYTPLPRDLLPPEQVKAASWVEWERGITEEEYQRVLDYLEEFRIRDGFVQEYTPLDNLLPDFSRPNAFPANLASPIWSWVEWNNPTLPPESLSNPSAVPPH
ncbi:MAG: radical SAM protein [Spirochaetes bacterium]|nr:radical SAM protein [Spirochaetota bacterium]